METQLDDASNSEFVSISILPMRHGNYEALKTMPRIYNNFDPTYEAWKPSWIGDSHMMIYNISILPMRHGNTIKSWQ